MEARRIRLALSAIIACVCSGSTSAQILVQAPQEFVAHSDNFIVFATSPQLATEMAQVAEQHRRNLSEHWLGRELPRWPQRCPVHVHAGPRLAAQGETRYSLLERGTAGNWHMSVTGTPERIMDSVLPHEITHTIFASHFAALGKYVPRWADEGACTTVEHESEKCKHRDHLVRFLKTGRGLAFNTMFQLKEYPQDILPLYAQGHSAVQFLINQGGPQKFVKFIEAGMKTENWPSELQEFYAYDSIGKFQTSWNSWLAAGSPADLSAYAPSLREPAGAASTLVASTPPLAAGAASTLVASTPATAAGAADSSQAGWYSRQLRQISGSPATPVPPHNTVAMATLGQLPGEENLPPSAPAASNGVASLNRQTSARPMPAQSTEVQVMDWGASGFVPGIQQPIYR